MSSPTTLGVPDHTRLFSLDDTVALVTGAGTGLGLGAALALAAAGSTVVLAGRKAATLDAARQQIAQSGGQAEILCLDVTDASAVDVAIAGLGIRFGHLDVLVNNAGVALESRPADITPAAWDAVIAVNLTGAFNCAKAFAKVTGGVSRSIVNVVSLAAAVGVRGQSAYAASKGGLLALTRALALDFAAQGIRVNALAPGYFRTQMSSEVVDDPDSMARLIRRIPLRRVGEPAEIAGPIIFLASRASEYMTGACLYFDGGYTAQ